MRASAIIQLFARGGPRAVTVRNGAFCRWQECGRGLATHLNSEELSSLRGASEVMQSVAKDRSELNTGT